MGKNRLTWRMLILSGVLTTGLQAQDVIPAAGGNGSGSGGSFSYSAGQIVFTTLQGDNGSTLQGVQQPYEIFTSGSLNNVIETLFPVSVYPNPSTDHLILDTGPGEMQNLWYHLYDPEGKLIKSEKLTHSPTTISMGNLKPSTYFLKITRISGDNSYTGSEDQIQYDEVKTFKIIKN